MDVKVVLLAGLMGFLATTLKSIPSFLLGGLTYFFSYRTSINSQHTEGYKRMNSWVINNLHSNILERRIKCDSYWEDGDYAYLKTIGLGRIMFFEKGTLFVINHVKQENNFNVEYQLDIDIIGSKAKSIYEDILKYSLISKDKETINVKIGYNIISILKRSFDTLYGNKKEIENIKKQLDFFTNNKKLYEEMGTPYKKGILLYGKPGTGKTSMAKAIASHLNRSIRVIKITDLDNIEKTMGEIKTNEVLLIEEIDTISINREEENSKNNEKILGNLLNIIDGVGTPDNLIIVATTNYVEKLDSAMVRGGRFDLKIEMKYIDKEEGGNILLENNLPLEMAENIEFPIAPCDLQMKVMEEKAKRL